MKDTYKELAVCVGGNVSRFDLWSVANWMDSFIVDVYLAKKLPNCTKDDPNDPLWKKLSFIYTVSMYLSLYHQEEQKRAVNTPFFNNSISNFDRAIKGDKTYRW